jgi:type I restriction enzyme M protein
MTTRWREPLIELGPKERVDVIVTNPPFGGMEEDGIETNFPASLPHPGNRRSVSGVDHAVAENRWSCRRGAAGWLPVWRRHQDPHQGKAAGASATCTPSCACPMACLRLIPASRPILLFFTKGTPTQHIWFYEHPYPPGVKSYNKTKPMKIEEFDAEAAWWGIEADGFNSRAANQYAWKVSLVDIKARNYNLDCKNPHIGEQEIHDPDVLLAQYQAMQNDIAALRGQLKSILNEALQRGNKV